jgi:hypothetical protein
MPFTVAMYLLKSVFRLELETDQRGLILQCPSVSAETQSSRAT